MKRLINLFTKKTTKSGLYKQNTKEVQQKQIKEKKEAAFNEVGERYGRAITRLSDT